VGQSVEVVVSELHSASARLEAAAHSLKDGLASVNDETTQLLGSGWNGGAASAYGPAWEQWHNGANQVVQGLQRMSELLTIAGKEYAKTDESGAHALGSTVQSSGGSAGSGGGGAAGGQGVPDLGLGGGGGASNTGGAGASGQPADGAQQAMSSVSQLGQAVAGMPQQTAQAVAGLAQQAAQLAMGLAQQAGEGRSDKGDAPAAQDDEDKRDDQREHPEARRDEPEKHDGAGASSGEQSAGSAPAESTPVHRGDTTRPPSDQAIRRTR
jgi:WXG100 family type VII secretion target